MLFKGTKFIIESENASENARENAHSKPMLTKIAIHPVKCILPMCSGDIKI